MNTNIDLWIEELKSLSKDKYNQKYFIQRIIKYIEYGIGIVSQINDFKNQSLMCRKYFEIIQDFISEENQDIFFEEITQTIFQIIIEEDTQSWHIKKNLLQFYNNCTGIFNKSVKLRVLEKLPNIYLFKLIDSISTCGDYDFQASLIETVFFIYGKQMINTHLKELIPESEQLSQSFADIRPLNFDEDVRTFLNILNKDSDRIFSFVCPNVKLGDINIINPMENNEGLWIDINLRDTIITWYCSKSSFFTSNLSTSDDSEWNLITLFKPDIDKISIHRDEHGSRFFVNFDLKNPCICASEMIQHVINKAYKLTFVLENRLTSEELVYKVLPDFFGETFDTVQNEMTIKVSKSSKLAYKPLHIKVSKPKRSVQNASLPSEVFNITASRSDTISSLHSRTQGSSTRTDISANSSLSNLMSPHKDIQILSSRCAMTCSDKADPKVSKFKNIVRENVCQPLKTDISNSYATADEIIEVKISNNHENYDEKETKNMNKNNVKINNKNVIYNLGNVDNENIYSSGNKGQISTSSNSSEELLYNTKISRQNRKQITETIMIENCEKQRTEQIKLRRGCSKKDQKLRIKKRKNSNIKNRKKSNFEQILRTNEDNSVDSMNKIYEENQTTEKIIPYVENIDNVQSNLKENSEFYQDHKKLLKYNGEINIDNELFKESNDSFVLNNVNNLSNIAENISNVTKTMKVLIVQLENEKIDTVDKTENNIDKQLNNSTEINRNSINLSENSRDINTNLLGFKETIINKEINEIISKDVEHVDTLINSLENIKEQKTETIHESEDSSIINVKQKKTANTVELVQMILKNPI